MDTRNTLPNLLPHIELTGAPGGGPQQGRGIDRRYVNAKALTEQGAAAMETLVPPARGDRRGPGILRMFTRSELPRLAAALETILMAPEPTKTGAIWTPELIAAEKHRMDRGIALLCGYEVAELAAIVGPDWTKGRPPMPHYDAENRRWIKPGDKKAKAAAA